MDSLSLAEANGLAEEPLFDPAVLGNLDWEERKTRFKPLISPKNPGENLKMRPLQADDFNKGFVTLLSQLTKVGEVSQARFLKSFSKMKACEDTYFIVIIEDVTTEQVVGCATLLVEQKIIHCCAKKGYVEDVVVAEDYRGKQLGKLLIETLTQLAKELGLYKVVLNCKDQMIKFYETHGYCKEPNNSSLMVLRFRD